MVLVFIKAGSVRSDRVKEQQQNLELLFMVASDAEDVIRMCSLTLTHISVKQEKFRCQRRAMTVD
jgi:hypothetical protein